MAKSTTFSIAPLAKKGIILKNIDYAYNITPIHICSRIFGLVPFKIVRASNGEIEGARVNKFDVVWFVVSMCLYLFLAYAYIETNGFQPNPDDSYILTLGDNLLIAAGLVYATLIIAMDMYNRQKIVEILKQFISFDRRVNTLIIFKFQVFDRNIYSGGKIGNLFRL